VLIINTVCKLWLLLDRESHDLYNEMFNSMNGIEGFPQEEKEACDAVRMRGILGDALYREDMSDEEMCGAIGMIIAHEIVPRSCSAAGSNSAHTQRLTAEKLIADSCRIQFIQETSEVLIRRIRLHKRKKETVVEA